jgi:hypothetical protein
MATTLIQGKNADEFMPIRMANTIAVRTSISAVHDKKPQPK